jgi:uncharacterized membrane protein
MKPTNEKRIHLFFEVGIVLKGLHALIEIVGGILLFIISKAFIISSVLSITQEELSEDPKDFIAHYLINSANQLSVSTQHFAAIYLLSHGVIKIFLVIGLLRNKLWAYPTSIVVFSLFVIYQMFRFYFTHSIWLLALTILDLVIIGLTWHEYKFRTTQSL